MSINQNIIPNINQNIINSNIIDPNLNINNLDNINNQLISQLNYNLSPNNILYQNQNIIPQNIEEISKDLNNFNNVNNNAYSFNPNENYNYPSTNQLIDNVQILNNNINQNSINNNISDTPWGQMNLTYEEYEKKRIKEENRKKQEEFRKMLDEQRVQKLYNKQNDNNKLEDTTKRPKQKNPLIDLPIIITNEKKIIDNLHSSLKKGELVSENKNNINIAPNIQQYNEIIDNNNFYENQLGIDQNLGEEPQEIIAKKYQDMLNNYIEEKTKDIEIQRNQVINDNNLIGNFDNDIIDNNSEINKENELIEENINNIKKLNNKAKLRIKLANNKTNKDDKNKTEFNMFRKEYDKKNKTINNNEGNNKFIIKDKKNLTNKINGKSSNIRKIYKLNVEPQKNDPIFVKKNDDKKVQQRSRSLIPKVKIPPKSSEIKIKYTVKERKMNNNIKKNDKNENLNDDPINKLQNIQNYIKDILHEYKDNK